jgi:hypothetical protein
MSDLVITHGAGPNRSEILAAGVLYVARPEAFTFSHGGETKVVNVLTEVPPRKPDGNYYLPLPENALLPDRDAFHDIGGAWVSVQLAPVARPPSYNGPAIFLFSYEVSRPLAAPTAKAA